METKVLTVSNAKAYYTRAAAVQRKRRPTIRMQGDWLNEIGFHLGKSVTAEYAKGSIILRPQDSGDYKNLVKGALKTSSGLFQVRRQTNNKKRFPRLDIWGCRLAQFGFTINSVVIARFTYGLIKLSLVDLDQLEKFQGKPELETRPLVVTGAKSSVPPKRRPTIKFGGSWLDEIGFKSGKLAQVECGQGEIIFRLQDSEPDPNLKKRTIRASCGLFLIQQNGKQLPQIDIKGFWLEKFGFSIGKTLTACYEYGLLTLSLDDKEDFLWKQESLR